MNAPEDIWAVLEADAPQGCEAVQDLYSWSLNFDTGTGPFALFLDLTGWSEDNIGDKLFSEGVGLGYVECAKLGATLCAYADRPADVTAYVERLMAAESV